MSVHTEGPGLAQDSEDHSGWRYHQLWQQPGIGCQGLRKARRASMCRESGLCYQSPRGKAGGVYVTNCKAGYIYREPDVTDVEGSFTNMKWELEQTLQSVGLELDVITVNSQISIHYTVRCRNKYKMCMFAFFMCTHIYKHLKYTPALSTKSPGEVQTQ